ncbi:hypothetical protein TIFTF001_055480 [Ficus carica]|uniref:Uncharacterized protein n=1 Tax=Ficus carica TaxID=3494 RepID=A0AA88JEH6_FICCA|nr:hypothetical protein TIFTF001_055480 [Ficus carica]
MSKAAPHAAYERIFTKSRFYWRMDNAPHSAMRTKKAALSPCSFACRPSVENSPPVVDRELTAPPFIVATVVMEKEFVFCQRSMLNTAYSVKAFEPRLN